MNHVGLAMLMATAAVLPPAQPDSTVLDAQSRRIAVIERVKDCVLAVFPPGGQGGGSGVVISPDGYAVSNFHVVQPCGRAMQCGMADGRVYDAVLVGVDPVGDVALIKLFGRDDFPCATLGDSDRVRAGDWVFAMGNPFMLATDMQPAVSYGIVSGVHRYQYPAGTLLEYADCLQIDAAINPGNSGGPLFDAEGRLIGVNGRASFEKRGRVNVGAAYAISINQIQKFLGALGGGRIVDHATLGATVGADDQRRVVVTDILETSDAFRRGLRYDDEIIAFGGRPVATPNGLKNILGTFPAGWRVPLSFRRDGTRYDVLVRLAGVHHQAELIEKTSNPPLMPAPKPEPEKKGKKTEPKPPEAVLPVPEIVEKHFIEKRGYANYYFNQIHRQRVWSAWIELSNLDGIDGPWALAGHRILPSPTEGEAGSKFRFLLSDDGASLRLPNAVVDWTAGGDPSASLPPAGSGGLLPALYLWRCLAVEGLERFGDVYYFGTAPLGTEEKLYDVLIGVNKGFECRFYFDPADGRLAAIEMFADEYGDPCEVYFSRYAEREGRWWPGRIEVRHGDQAFAAFEVEEARCEK